jgi:alpha-galactosidase
MASAAWGCILPSDPLAAKTAAAAGNTTSSYLEILRAPDAIIAFAGRNNAIPLLRIGEEWGQRDISVRTGAGPDHAQSDLEIHLFAPRTNLTHLHLRWRLRVPGDLRFLGDQWERSYGDLEWRGFVPNRVMPWYFLTFNGKELHGYGVQTRPSAFCFWQADPEGVSLWLDVRNGGDAVQLGERALHVATVVTYRSQPEEPAPAAARRFCRAMCPQPRLPRSPLCGSNDWYYAYGKNTEEGILRDADLVAALAPSAGHRPLVVIDDGWQDATRFPSMPGLAEKIRARNLRPGLWIRPLRASQGTKANLLLPDARFAGQPGRKAPAYDPTIPEAMEKILDSIRTPVSWAYQFIKHDFSTYELLGQWGSEMQASPAVSGWSFSDRTRTTAEIFLDFYDSLRKAAGDEVILLGCNTVGHLAAGTFESQRIGDDTSGRIWERTRRMGVNALGFRMPQHRSFFFIDPDCVAITREIDWRFTRQWLDLVARSGVSLFVSAQPEATGPEQRAAIREAFLLAASSYGHAEDWYGNTTPQQWKFQPEAESTHSYQWLEGSGADPFSV